MNANSFGIFLHCCFFSECALDLFAGISSSSVGDFDAAESKSDLPQAGVAEFFLCVFIQLISFGFPGLFLLYSHEH
jgi:hypothetical protein